MLSEHTKLENKIVETKAKLKKSPPGKLVICNNGTRAKWYQSDGHTKKYISKKQRNFAEQLALKKYLSLQLDTLSHEKKAIEFYLRHHVSTAENENTLFQQTSPYRELLLPSFLPSNEELCNWMNSPYEHNTKHPEHLIYKGLSGKLLRSKSEAIIDMCLYTNKIPFRYECALQLGEIFLFPDFTIRHPITGETYYWEHFGLMDEPSYSKNACAKLQIYTSNGIIPSIQLITTYETKNAPLSPELVEKIVTYYFL